MNALEAASLVMIPSGYENGTLGSLKPLDGTGDFTFSRGSDISATRVNEQGLIEKGYENLLLQSNQFDTTWTTDGTPSLSSGQSGYDGSSDAWLYTNNGSDFIYQDETTNVATYSVFAKKGNGGVGDFILLFTDGVGGRYFDLDNGVLGSEVLTGLIDSKIELVSGTTDWYRCSVTFASSTRVRIYASLADGDFSSVASIYIQDAMFNQGLLAYPYVETTTAPVAGGILEDEPRLSGSCPALLLEPQRTNSWTYSEPASGANEAPSSITTFAPIDMFSPIGVYGGVEFTGGVTRFQYGGGVAVNTAYSFSCYMRKEDSTAPILANNTSDSNGDFNFVLGGNIYSLDDITSSDYSIELFKDDIYKVVFTYTTGASVNAANNGIYKDDGNSNVGLFATGFQLEAGTYPTSYIPTYGTSQTRLKDLNSNNDTISTPISFGANEDFALYYEGSFDKDGNNGMIMGGGVASGGSDYRSYWWVKSGTMNLYGNGEIAMASTTFSVVKNTNYKLLVKRNGSVIDFFVNGTKLTTTQGTPNTEFTFRSLGWSYSYSVYGISGDIKKAIIFPTALSDDECIELTTI